MTTNNDYGIDMNGAALSLDHGTKLWEVMLGGNVTITISARNHVQALVLAAEGNHLDGLPWDDDVNVSYMSKDEAQRAQFWNEDRGTRIPLWDEWQRDTSPRVVACSEF